MKKEIWKKVIGFPGYEVSSLGRVKSHWRRRAAGYGRGSVSTIDPSYEVIKKLEKSSAGYTNVNLAYGEAGRRKKVSQDVHVLVLTYFKGPRPQGYEARHLDGNKSNNKVSNLEWGTVEENTRDRFRHGTTNRGEKCGTAKLTEDDVHDIRRLVKTTTLRLRQIGKMFNVRESAISRIMSGVRWSHLPERKVNIAVFRDRGGPRLIKEK